MRAACGARAARIPDHGAPFSRAVEAQARLLLEAAAPPAWLLSNGRYSSLITAAGTGGSWLGELALTRWGADRIEDGDGWFIYLRDLEGGAVWSLGHRPVQRPPGRYEVSWRPGRLEIVREDDGIDARLEICVVPDRALELRRVTLFNRSPRRRAIELTSYLEVVLNAAAADAAHPAFSKLFVQTEFDPEHEALLATRRPRAPLERWPWMGHAMAGAGALEYETDRARFIGRGGSLARPRALGPGGVLSGATGNVLDPVFALRRVVRLEAGASKRYTLLLIAGETREEVLEAAAAGADPGWADQSFERAEAHAGLELRHLGISDDAAARLQRLAGALLYGHPALRATAAVLARARGEREVRRRYGLAPDRPLILADARSPAARAWMPMLLRAWRYWDALGLRCELLLLGDDWGPFSASANGPTGESVRVLRASEIPPADLDRLSAIAHFVVAESMPELAGQALFNVPESPGEAPPAVAGGGGGNDSRARAARAADLGEPLQYFNGFGGFSADGEEYVIRIAHDGDAARTLPPRPWINVIANPRFGFIVSETGAGTTWSENSREHRLTPWSNDPVLDPHGEALYVRDDESGAFWSPLPGPAPAAGPYEMRHGFGYSTCRHSSEGLEQEVTLFVPRRDPVKIARVRLTNHSGRARRLSLFSYQRLVLGALTATDARHVVTELDRESNAILARNPMAGEFAGRVAFATVAAPAGSRPLRFSGDRETFIGRGGSPERPAALGTDALDGRTGAGLDPCFATQVPIEIASGQTLECAFVLGDGSGRDQARALIARYRAPQTVEHALRRVREFWRRTLGSIRIHTPSPAIDLMMNGWLLYQTMSCRLWGRSALYQSGGAFGFRDQLQDAAALTLVRPDLTRAQILLHAAHQFVEGDVLHWWHPPRGRGLRTRFADDLLWLPDVTASYVRSSGDRGILDERIPFLTARALAEGEDEALLAPAQDGHAASLYEHCCRAIDRAMTKGAHGLPLFGSGDWNDGMNAVGREGRGESVWVGFFLYAILGEFIPICERRDDDARAQRYRCERQALLVALNEAGWDGEWYRRGYYDSGDALGSHASEECRIDALAQAWAVLSGAAPNDRAGQALDAVERWLVSERDGLIRLLTPPFDHTPHHPGYIKGYPPGVRENGGQYTHAALWVVRAMAETGRRERAARLLEMMSPVTRARTREQAEVYQVEPYVVAADVYSEPPHTGRGGWTWYTGSAGLMFRTVLESVLGLQVVNGDTLMIRPCVPHGWDRCAITYRLPGGGAVYEIVIRNPGTRADGVVAVKVDGRVEPIQRGTACVRLARDAALHRVEVVLG